MVAYGGLFFEGQRPRLFGVNGRRGWDAKSCVRLGACFLIMWWVCDLTALSSVARPLAKSRKLKKTPSRSSRRLRFWRKTVWATSPTVRPQSLNLAELCATALITCSTWTDESWPWLLTRGPRRLGSRTGLSGAKFAQKTCERWRRRTRRFSEDSASRKGRCERWKSVDPIFINFSVTRIFPTHQIPWVRASQGDVEKVFNFCFLFLETGDPANWWILACC